MRTQTTSKKEKDLSLSLFQIVVFTTTRTINLVSSETYVPFLLNASIKLENYGTIHCHDPTFLASKHLASSYRQRKYQDHSTHVVFAYRHRRENASIIQLSNHQRNERVAAVLVGFHLVLRKGIDRHGRFCPQ